VAAHAKGAVLLAEGDPRPPWPCCAAPGGPGRSWRCRTSRGGSGS
jgi:hypothetical protein